MHCCFVPPTTTQRSAAPVALLYLSVFLCHCSHLVPHHFILCCAPLPLYPLHIPPPLALMATSTIPTSSRAKAKKKSREGKETAPDVLVDPDPQPEAHTTSHWTAEDESTLVAFLIEHKAEAGDGVNFKAATWKAVAIEMERHRTKGAVKSHLACKNKYACVRCFPFTSLNI